MKSIRTGRVALAAVATTLIMAVAAAAAGAPTIKLSGGISPKKVTRAHTPITLKIGTTFAGGTGDGGTGVLTKVTYLFPKGATTNGKLFPSCSVAKLKAAHNRLSACPSGSRIGKGTATGEAIALGVTSSGAMTLFNGPGGKSITLNIHVLHPADINSTFSGKLTKLSGKYGYKLAITVPDALQAVLGGPIVVSKIVATTHASRVINGVTRGYIESNIPCPKSTKLPFHADFSFQDGSSGSADTVIRCTR